MLIEKKGKNIIVTRCLQTGIMCLLIFLVFLTSCAVRQSIDAFLSGSFNVEVMGGGALKKISATDDQKPVLASDLCVKTDRYLSDSSGLHNSSLPVLLLPQALFLITLLGIFALRVLLPKTSLNYQARALEAFALTPIYIKNRLLLI